ncbi:hypothetical protein FOJ82_00650 [Tessaracoccus rhinocerotis]|uniref:Uncharacterized protein n=1 Tax=Tessaracoccus rhinocerotis TaxID=1689449 RepID=A0A553K442_9ACTN|nr:hypothetical protein [Tessaracoccus rhinocerotis]TRY19456.1 hypothetical protein FOJ82_00650 [Tessaracoccus rhinocerotis]
MVSALVVGLAYLVFGPRTNMTEPSPGVTSAPAPTNSTSAAAPTSPPTTPPAPEPSPTQSPPPTDSAPLPSPNPTTSLAPGASPTDPTEPAKPEDEPGGTALPAGTIELNDTTFLAADGWVLYGDDLVEGDRRVVRLSDPTSDTRLQVLTLLQDQDLAASCEALVAAQKGHFVVMSEQLARPVGVAPEEGTGVSCGFAGVRTSDGLANSVSFTLLRRAADSHVLMLRTTIPDAVGVGDQPRRDLTQMTCAASSGFGVPLPLC